MHPLGMLQYSAMELVVLYQSVKDVNCTHRVLPDMMEFHNEAIMVWTMAPVTVQVATFQSMWCSNPPTGEGELHTLPYQTPPNEETPCCIHAQLGDLNDSELQQLIWDLSREIAQCELTAPSSNPPPRDWAHPLGSGVPEEDDQEVTFPGGGRVPTRPQPQAPRPAPAGVSSLLP